jgi:hypothetical protein
MEIFVISIVACGAGITGFVSGLFYRKVIEKKIRDSYSTYLDELAESDKKEGFDPHKSHRKDYTDPSTWV